MQSENSCRKTEIVSGYQELNTAATEHDASERRVTELYTKAVEQLGSAQAAVRLGGLSALAPAALGGWLTWRFHWLWGALAGYGYRARRAAPHSPCSPHSPPLA